MNRLIAALAAFAVPAALAAYVHLVPDGELSLQLSAIRGREQAEMALLGLALILAGLAALLVGGFVRRRAPLLLDAASEIPPDDALPASVRPWTPEPDLRGPRHDATAHAAAPAPQPTAAPPAPVPPVILIRKPRERARDWFGDASWFGGLPRLGSAPWPRDETGALPFAAQIDLAELAATCPDMPLPHTGSLAFFLGSGAVVEVPETANDFADPPHDLPPAFDEGGATLPVRASRSSRWFFPFWPVTPVALDVAVDADDDAIEQAAATQRPDRAFARDHTFYAAGVGEPVSALWWHGVIHLADQLHEALEGCARPIALHEEAVARQHAKLARLRIDPQAQPYAAEDAQEELEGLEAELETLRGQCAALPDMAAALDQFVAERDPWTPLTADEREVAADILSEIHERYGEIVRHHVPGSVAQMATLSLRAMMSGPPDLFAALPDAVLARVNRDYRMAPTSQHRMFGPATPGDLMLLQLACDDLMEWNWPETGRFVFSISRANAAAGHWSAARLTFVES